MQDMNSKAVVLSRPFSLRIARLADANGCSYEETLAEVIERGLQEIEGDLAVSAGIGGLEDLSPRQRAVLGGLRDGLSVKELADSLEVSEVTIRTHIIRIRERLGCTDLLGLRMPDRR